MAFLSFLLGRILLKRLWSPIFMISGARVDLDYAINRQIVRVESQHDPVSFPPCLGCHGHTKMGSKQQHSTTKYIDIQRQIYNLQPQVDSVNSKST
ncbi:hypothetical protein I7I50_05530 [Histoplasma capsulatum G186AR]|uniref:Uncharacterized protein n=1 Tax=Ajellomyces capsulatus TaxID=5037 RepID=A0A8H7ZCE7_AJECA|nr:hypothetical protein I7I52_03791 [Histoplasma capsulatum]QSS76165.1 hypothetical protein I7I50_05530 [Histoplasma capsulatum G186AR]